MEDITGNKIPLFNAGGRPPHYETPELLAEKMQEYFNSFVPDDKGVQKIQGRPTVTGLTLFLGFCDKKSLRDYKEKPEFSPLIKKALTAVEMNYEEMLDSKSATGAIFALKNMGWIDKQEIDSNTNMNFSGSIDISKWIEQHSDSDDEKDVES